MGLVRQRIEGIRPYDFQRPHQLSRPQLDAMTQIMTVFWRVAGNFLSTYLRTAVQLQHLTMDQITYAEVQSAIHVPAVIGITSTSPFPGSAMVECTPIVALAMIDRALGGPGLGEYAPRRLTEIEQTIFRRMLDRLVALYRDTWAPITAIEPKVTAMEHNPAFAQIAADSDLVLVARQELSLDGHKGHITWSWPYANIQPQADAAARFNLSRDDAQESVEFRPQEMRRHVEATFVDAEVVLGKTQITLGEFSQLKVGDAMILKNRYNQPLTMAMSNRDKFQVLPGRNRGSLAVRVIGRVEAE